MSHFTKIRSKIVEKDALVKALADLGYRNVEVHEQAQHLYGYMGDKRPQTANVIIRRKDISPDSNDIGFKLMVDGTYQIIISEYDEQILPKFVSNIMQRYAYVAVVDKLQSQGFKLEEQETDKATQRIHLVLKRGA